jgi:hypothetical protein
MGGGLISEFQLMRRSVLSTRLLSPPCPAARQPNSANKSGSEMRLMSMDIDDNGINIDIDLRSAFLRVIYSYSVLSPPFAETSSY